jgi:arylsulfatase A
MKHRLLIIVLALSLIPAFVMAAEKPNVVLIFIDDMGYGDVGFNGATIPKTPNIDTLSKEGMQFSDFYVGCAVCTGSRTALMTGTHYGDCI